MWNVKLENLEIVNFGFGTESKETCNYQNVPYLMLWYGTKNRKDRYRSGKNHLGNSLFEWDLWFDVHGRCANGFLSTILVLSHQQNNAYNTVSSLLLPAQWAQILSYFCFFPMFLMLFPCLLFHWDRDTLVIEISSFRWFVKTPSNYVFK